MDMDTDIGMDMDMDADVEIGMDLLLHKEGRARHTEVPLVDVESADAIAKERDVVHRLW